MATTNQDIDLRADRADRPPPRPGGGSGWLLALAAAVGAGAVAAWLWWSQGQSPGQRPLTTIVVPDAAQPPAAPPAAPPAVKYPLAQDTAPLADQDLTAALADLLGAKAVAAFLQTDRFAHRVVASIDNLGREHAPPALWPVQPTGGRFTVEPSGGGTVIAAGNAARYAPFVQLVASLDAERTVQLYRRMYPLLQRAYRDLGFGDRYFNDRVVEVIDLLLAAPRPAAPPQLQLTEVKGPVPSTRPWLRYEFVDPELERLPAGQKILVRVGPEHQRRLQAKLAELRRHLVAGQPADPAAAR